MHPFFKMLPIKEHRATSKIEEKILYSDEELKILKKEYENILRNKRPPSEDKERYWLLRNIFKK